MAREQFQTLSEPMYYILLSLLEEECGVDIMNKVGKLSNGRISVGPGTLYTLLDKFLKAYMIAETKVEGRRKSYIITNSGKEALKMEQERLKKMLEDGSMFEYGSDKYKEGGAAK
ncbi:MAG TPA: PadR family transcriptional regulator [Proteiniclasticum sp.]|nr:PadR family transcriptional regulator [Proteiniclasticum sp.]